MRSVSLLIHFVFCIYMAYLCHEKRWDEMGALCLFFIYLRVDMIHDLIRINRGLHVSIPLFDLEPKKEDKEKS